MLLADKQAAVSRKLGSTLGALGISVLVGWRMARPSEELRAGAGAFFARVASGPVLLLRWAVPLLLLAILWLSWRRFADTIAGYLS